MAERKENKGDEAAELLLAQHLLILDAAGEGIYGLDGNGRITFVNKAATRILGWRSEDVFGRLAHEVHHHSYEDGSPYPREECPIFASLRDGEVHRVDNEVFWHTDGNAVPVSYVSTPIIRDGKPQGAVIIFRDDSLRRETEQEKQVAFDQLKELRTTYELILGAAGEGIYGLDSDGLITFSNDAATQILGWKGEHVMGRASHEIHHHTHADGSIYPRENCPIYKTIESGEVHRIANEVFWHTNGNPVPVEYTSTPILKNGQPEGAVVVFRDVSDRKAVEAEREQAYEEIKLLKEQLQLERDYLREEVETTGSFGEIIGHSVALKRTLSQVEAVATTPASVLILGESGVGKEMIARAIHMHSPRADKPMIKVNCASIPGELFESEFFGHVKGSFTGAHQDRVGRLQMADSGTLFLDEVGEIPLAQQGKLLRALQEAEFERVGDDKTLKVDVRVIAATNRDLEEEIKAGRFREDFYYRLSVFPIEVPPLRERLDDIVPLAVNFLEKICGELGRETMQLTKSQAKELQSHHWPGNIRELKNTIERAVICSSGQRLRLDMAMQQTEQTQPAQPIQNAGNVPGSYLTLNELKEFERANIIAALNHANWKIWGDGGAADLLGIKPSTLAYQIKTLGIEKPRSE